MYLTLNSDFSYRDGSSGSELWLSCAYCPVQEMPSGIPQMWGLRFLGYLKSKMYMSPSRRQQPLARFPRFLSARTPSTMMPTSGVVSGLGRTYTLISSAFSSSSTLTEAPACTHCEDNWLESSFRLHVGRQRMSVRHGTQQSKISSMKKMLSF